MVKDQVDAGGNDDATHGRQHGKHGLTRILELADRHLVLKLNTHQQKENRHEKVVDEKLNGETGRKVAQTHIQRGLQKVMDGLVGIGIGANDGGDGGEDHDGGGNRAVLGDALPDVVTLKTLALTDVEQLLGCCHGRLLSREGSRLKKARPAQVAAPRSNVLRLHLPTLHDKHAGVAEKRNHRLNIICPTARARLSKRRRGTMHKKRPERGASAIRSWRLVN